MTFGTACIVLLVQLFDVGRKKTALASLRGRFDVDLIPDYPADCSTVVIVKVKKQRVLSSGIIRVFPVPSPSVPPPKARYK